MESSTARRAPRLALAGILLLAAALRAGVVARVPDLYGPGDPGIYLAMARGWVREGAPRVDFVHHLLTRPATIHHLEDYYEPAFGLLLAGPLAASGGRTAAARLLLCACSVLTVALVWRLGRRFGERAAWIAALIVALEPWSVSYGGLLMKEALVGLLVIVYLGVLLWAIEARASTARTALGLIGLTGLASALQYELLPVVGAATSLVLLVKRREVLPAYVLGVALGTALVAGVTWRWIGVPISAKYLFFLGAGISTAGATAPPPPHLAAFLPVETVARELILSWHPVLLLLAILGARRAGPVALPWAALTGAWLYFHGVPHDLWARDFVPLTAIAAPLAGAALADREAWRARRFGPALALAALTFATLTLLRHPLHLPLDEGRRWFWPAAGAVLAAAGLIFMLAGVMSAPLSWLRPHAPLLLAVALAVSVASRLTLADVYRNAEFPGREVELERIERIAHRMVAGVPRAPLIAAYPVEWHLATEWPTVCLPERASVEAILELRDRYATRYLLATTGDLRDSVRRALPMRPRLAAGDDTLYEFTAR